MPSTDSQNQTSRLGERPWSDLAKDAVSRLDALLRADLKTYLTSLPEAEQAFRDSDVTELL